MPEISELLPADARDAWPHEALDFTPWLAENLDRLGKILGISMDLEGTEVAVESFSADILAINNLDESRVLIENQLAVTDHSHLGQIMTYLAGLDVRTVIWIATDFRAPHVSAINWLNEHTADGFSFFGVKLGVVRIGDSPLAPIFEVVARPNDWERKIKAAASAKSGPRSDIAQMKRDFWDAFLAQHPDSRDIGVTETSANNIWLIVPSKLKVMISIWAGKSDGVGLFIRGLRGAPSEETLEMLEPYADLLEQQLLTPMEPNMKWGHFFGQFSEFDMGDKANWPAAIDWLNEKARQYFDALTSLKDEE